MPGLDVLLYSFDTRNSAKRDQATRWLDYLWRRGTGLPSQARDAVAVFAQWRPGGMNIDLITRGWFWMDQAQLSHWDSLILASAERLACSILPSEDFQTNRRFEGIRVVNP